MMRYDAIVVGSGLAGLMTAVEMAPMRVLLLTRDEVGAGSSSTRAQGGVAAALAGDDSADLHASDTIAAGAGLVDAALARQLAGEAPAVIARMVALGARLDRREDGTLAMGREAAHSRCRIVHAHGDATGRELVVTAAAAVRAAPHVTTMAHATVTRLRLDGSGRVRGVGFVRSGEAPRVASAPRVVLATGGLGALYRRTTNPSGQWGAGIALAAHAGATLADLEFVQFHPTALDVGLDPMPLVTEALRGEGALLVDERGTRIMDGMDPRGELAPRDVVARAVYAALRQGRRVFLDARAWVGSSFPLRFPGVFAASRAAGIDPRVERMPVAPAAHYHMGGIAVDARGRSSVPGLWACGEAAATGVHGANRLASNSLLEALVFARRVAGDASSCVPLRSHGFATTPPDLPYATASDDASIGEIRRRMFADVGIARDGAALRAACDDFRLYARGASSQRLRDMATVASLVADAAERRRESRGAHYRSDYPHTDARARRSFSLRERESGRIPA